MWTLRLKTAWTNNLEVYNKLVRQDENDQERGMQQKLRLSDHREICPALLEGNDLRLALR
jgi:hypothetical protein